jgi:hypothetical protein
MQWWNDFVEWLGSDEGWTVLSTVVIPFVAIVVAGIVAAAIGRNSMRRMIALNDRERRTAAVTALIGAARRASKWNTLSVPEQQHAEHLAHEADVSIRLLPLNGTAMTADWAAHEITQMKKNAVSFSFQAEQSLVDFRDRLVEWQAKPSRAKKLFKNDLDAWAYESSQSDQELVQQQQQWAKQQVASETGPISTAAKPADTPATTHVPPYERPRPSSPPSTQAAIEPANAAPQSGTFGASGSAPTTRLLSGYTRSVATTPATSTSAADTPPAATTASHAASPAGSSESPSDPSVTQSTTAAVPVGTSSPVTQLSDAPEVYTPTPVSANTVRQRTSPDVDED